MSNSEHQETYEAILTLYDLAEELIHTAEAPSVIDEDAHLTLIEPLVQELAESADMLVEEYAALVKHGAVMDENRKKKMEMALGKLLSVIEQCKKLK